MTLLHGPYTTLCVRIGQTLVDEVRGIDVVVVGLTDARIGWPIGKAKGGRTKAPIVCGDLERAVRLESNLAVCYWFGITPQTVSKWRKLLGVPRMTEGTKKLAEAVGNNPGLVASRVEQHHRQRNPQTDIPRRQKIAAALAGRAKSKRAVAKMVRAKRGVPLTTEHRSKLSEAAKRNKASRQFRRGRDWTVEEDEIVRTLKPLAAARTLGRLLGSVYSRRYVLGVRSRGRDTKR